jgi:hypothetical protein
MCSLLLSGRNCGQCSVFMQGTFMKMFTLVFSPLCMALLGLFGSEVSAQSPLIPGLQESGSPTVVPGMAMTMKSFDSLEGTPQTLDPLPQTLAAVFGAPLAEAIQQGRNRAYPHAQPIPQAIRAQLTPFFPHVVLHTVRYSTDWDTTAEGTLPYFLLGNGAVKAVTFGDVILFRDAHLTEDPLLWAHELTHVEQYRRLGVETFAIRYLQQAWVLENEAITKANMIKGRLSR